MLQSYKEFTWCRFSCFQLCFVSLLILPCLISRVLFGEKQVEFHINLIASILFKMALYKSAFLMSHDCWNIEKGQGIYFLNTEKMLSNGVS